jgi:hypothetical protein
MLGAEYVFYWNVFSNSVLARVANRLPVFFFDCGHMAYAIPPLLEVGLRRYYPGCTLPFLDPRRPLAPGELAAEAARQEPGLEGARANVRRSPPPDVMVAELLGAAGGGPAP